MVKNKGHQRGTSHSKKKFDKYYGRNYYAKELYNPDNKYRQRVLTEERNRKVPEKEILKELEDG